MRYSVPVLAAFAAIALVVATDAEPAESGVIFMYHHVDVSTPAATSVHPDEFIEQMDWLAREGFTVLPLLDLIETLSAGDSLPEKSVAITFDDAYSSILTTAMPVLRERDWPFTVFVSTEAIDRGYRGYLSWDELRELGRNGATFGNHTVSHAHLVRRPDDESEAAWKRRISAEIVDARTQLDAELGARTIPVFAWPYGEYTVATKQLLGDSERFGLGQHSGASGPDSDFLALPRYPVATGLELDEFALRARSRPLPVELVGPERHIPDPDEQRPALRLALDATADVRVEELACYASGQGRMQLEWLDDRQTRLVVSPGENLRAGRSKYNCTAPSRNDAGVWYWFGYLWMRQLPDGSWYAE